MSAESSLLESTSFQDNDGQGGAPEKINFTTTSGAQFDGDFGGSGPCYFEKIDEEKVDLKILIVLDRSSSMLGAAKWDVSIAALTKFFDDPKMSGTGIALNFFPYSAPPTAWDPNNPNPYCNALQYNPPHVPMGILPQHFGLLYNILTTEDAQGGSTPLYGALEGSYNWAVEYIINNPQNRIVVLLVSDGDPSGCGPLKDNSVELSKLSSDAHDMNVDTFTIGMSGADMYSLDLIAKSGGTKGVIDVTDDIDSMYEKINEIRNLFRCEYDIPFGYDFDFQNILVEYRSSIGLPIWQLPRAVDASGCKSTLGWYFDNNADPKKVIICDLACDIIITDPNPEVYYAFGCLDGQIPE